MAHSAASIGFGGAAPPWLAPALTFALAAAALTCVLYAFGAVVRNVVRAADDRRTAQATLASAQWRCKILKAAAQLDCLQKLEPLQPGAPVAVLQGL